MRKHAFERLVDTLWDVGLRHTRVTVQEQVAIFLYTATTGLPNRKVAERFQRSGDTISRRSISYSTRYFQNSSTQNCLGALDGTHVHITAPSSDKAKYRNRKGVTSQNVLVACTFDMRICFVLSGWEGSASDGTIFDDARTHGLSIPPNKFYLADAGFALSDALLVPYRGVRYHLREWEASKARPSDYRELFNLRHSSARTVIERTFGVIKRRFKMFQARTEYPLKTQAQVIPALCALHNFILTFDVDDAPDPAGLDVVDNIGSAEVSWASGVTSAERERAAERRDDMAKQMWEVYQSRSY